MAKSALGRSFGSLIIPPSAPSLGLPTVGDDRRSGVGLLLRGHDSRIAGPIIEPLKAETAPPAKSVLPTSNFAPRSSEPNRETSSPLSKPADSFVLSARTRLLLLATDLALIGVSTWLLLFSRDAGSLGSAIASIVLLSAGAGAAILAFRD